MTICDPSWTGYKYGRTFWMDEDPYYRDIGAQMLDEKDNRLVGPVISRGYWGWLMTIYKPLYDPEGNKVAFIGVDLDMNQAMTDINALYAKILSLECVIFSMMLAMIYTFITRQVIAPVKTLQGMLLFFREHREIALQGMSKALCDIFEHSQVYRIGGDEFVVVLTGRDYMNRDALVQKLAPYERVRDGSAYEPWTEVAMAIGLSVYDPLSDRTYGDTFNRADEAMYENKRRIKAAAGEA